MIDRIKTFLIDRKARATGGHARHSTDEFHLAAAALLVEVATVDDRFDDDERARIAAFARDRLGLSEQEAETLVAAATEQVAEATQLFAFTRTITAGFSYDERVRLMQTLWEVALADGEVDPFEDQLLRRIGGLIHVSDHDRGSARKRARNAVRAGRA